MHIWCSFLNIPSHLREKSTQKLTDLPEVKEKFSFPLLRKRTAGAQFDSSFQHQVLLMRWTKSSHCLDSLTNYSRCMSSLIFLPSVKAVMTNITCFLSKFVMFLKYTPFSRAYYCFKFTLHRCVFSLDIFWQFCRESKTFSWPFNPLVCFCANFFHFTEVILFNFE